MGTPLSFTILTLINGWCCNTLGPLTAICGDDVVSVTRPRNVAAYAKRVASVGSGLHERKSFFGKKGWTFCELFGVVNKYSGRCEYYNPYPLKQFMRDGTGVMDKGNYFAPQWKALRRVARVLCKGVRAKGRRLGRYPELPAALGGLGHPSKGMRDMPKAVRAQLYSLINDIDEYDPSKYASRIDIFFSPSDPRMFESIRSTFGEDFKDKAWGAEGLEPPEGMCFVSNRTIRRHVVTQSHRLYWSFGGSYRSYRPRAMKPGKLKLPPPGPRQFSSHTPWDMVLRWWRETQETEGKFLPIDEASGIRGKPSRRDRPVQVGRAIAAGELGG